MPIIRANDPNANNLSYQVKSVLGKMCDESLSVKARYECTDKLTDLLAGKSLTVSTFTELGIEAKITENPQKNEKYLIVHVPKEFVSSNIKDNRDNQWISFGVNKVLDTSNLGNDSITVEEMK